MSSLPRDIIIDILTRLPVRSIARFKCVSKSWNYLFGDIQFCKLHYDRVNIKKKGTPIKIIVGKGNDLYSIDAYNSILSGASKIVDYPLRSKKHQSTNYDKLGILGSCYGLVCIRPRLERFCIWNPATKKHKVVPKLKRKLPTKSAKIKHGFGYDLKNQDYKLVRFDSFKDNTLGSQIRVYSLASNSWSATPYKTPYTFSRRPALYLNGALHCLTYNSKVLVSFDLGDHIIREVPGPKENNFFDDSSYRKYVDVLGGELCMICILPGVRGDVWVMKEYGVRESWTKVFTVPQRAIDFYYFRPIEYIHNREQDVLLNVRLKNTGRNVLVCYNKKRKRATTLQTHDNDPIWRQANTYEESLFSVLRKQNSDGIRSYLDDEQVEQEEELSKHDHKRRKII